MGDEIEPSHLSDSSFLDITLSFLNKFRNSVLHKEVGQNSHFLINNSSVTKTLHFHTVRNVSLLIETTMSF